eukprot:8462936-Pyramimonas_sp.AAC.1
MAADRRSTHLAFALPPFRVGGRRRHASPLLALPSKTNRLHKKGSSWRAQPKQATPQCTNPQAAQMVSSGPPCKSVSCQVVLEG